MIVKSGGRWKRSAISRNLIWAGLIRADLRLAEPDLTRFPPSEYIEEAAERPAVRCPQTLEGLDNQSGASVSPSVLTSGAGNHSERNSRGPKEFTQTPCQPWSACNARWPAQRMTGFR